MAVKSIAILKTFFETGDRPTESQFADLIDSFLHKSSGSAVSNYSYDDQTGVLVLDFSDGGSITFNVLGAAEQPISFITGLQSALDGKANDNEVVKSVNNVAPDAAGNVTVEVTGESSQFIDSLIPTLTDAGGGATYTFDEVNSVFQYVKTGSLINFNFTFSDIDTTGTPSGVFMISNLLFDVDQRASAEIFLIQNSDLTSDEIARANFIISKDPSNNMSLSNKEVTLSASFTNGTLEVSGFYVELQDADGTEGIGFDPVGTEALGDD